MSICLNPQCVGLCYGYKEDSTQKYVEEVAKNVYIVYCQCCKNGYGVEDLNTQDPCTLVVEPTGAPVCSYAGHSSAGLVIVPKQDS